MGHLDTTLKDSDYLFQTSRQLVVATTPVEVLEAVSGYARAKGAVAASLGYFEDFQPKWLEIVASWAEADVHLTVIGLRLDVTERLLSQMAISTPTQPTFVEDMLNSEIVGPESRVLAEKYQVRGAVILPLYSNGRWIANITFNWDRPYQFDEHDVHMYSALQQYAASAVATIRLFDQTRRRAIELEQTNQELNLLYRASEVINKSRSYEEIVEAVSYFDPHADVVTLMLWEHFDWDTANYLDVVVVFDRTGKGPLQSGVRLRKEDFPIAHHMLGQRVWLFEDAHTDPRVDPVTAQNWAALNIRAFMGPALYNGDRWMGGITFHTAHPRYYSEREIRLFTAIGGLVAAAVQRVHLQQETEAARRAAEMFAAQAQQLAAAEERNRLARELHDSVSQVLYSISLWGHSARAFLKHDPSRIGESVDYILSLAEVGLSEMRTLIFELRPELLEEEGLVGALLKQAESLKARHGIEITTDLCPEPPLSIGTKSDLYRIAREALHNAIKHAQATHITLTLRDLQPGYQLEIADNGVGFDPTQSFPGHLGLKSMNERTTALNGALKIESAPGAGTRISLTVHPQ